MDKTGRQPANLRMAVANIVGLYILFPVVKKELDSYWGRLKSGEIKKFTVDHVGT